MIESLLLLRIIPYAFVFILAWQKGYKRLSAVAIWLGFLAVLNYAVPLDLQIRSALSSVTAMLLLWHAADIRSRK